MTRISGIGITNQSVIQLADLAVPAQDSADNDTIRDVIGNKTDTPDGDSIYACTKRLCLHLCAESEVYPSLAAGATVISAAANWTYGNYATVIPVNTITNNYHIHHVTIETCDKNAVFELALYKGAADDLIATLRFSVVGGFWGNSIYRISSECVDANSQIRVRMASSDGAVNQATMTISAGYIEEL